jgi:hypothetical protein
VKRVALAVLLAHDLHRTRDTARCTVEDVLAAMDRAETGDIAKVDDSRATPAECFFRYLRQQEAAAAEAARSGRCLVTLTMS